MARTPVVEAALNAILAKELATNEQFAHWFLRQTRFSGEEARCVEVRANNPWSSVRLRVSSPTGTVEDVVRDAETDVLAIYATFDGRRLGVHIENKLAAGRFTLYQPETYRERLNQWRRHPKLGMYVEATSVLVAHDCSKKEILKEPKSLRRSLPMSRSLRTCLCSRAVQSKVSITFTLGFLPHTAVHSNQALNVSLFAP